MTACQRWQDRTPSWRHTSEGGFDRNRYGTAEIGDDTTAADFIEQHHYSGSYVAALARYGLYDLAGEGTPLVGVAVLSNPTNVAVLENPFPDLEPYAESAELGRLVLLDEVPANAESFFVAEMFRMAARRGFRGVVSHSDPNPRYDDDSVMTMPGHLGIVYQALNARYTGTTGRATAHVFPDGTELNGKTQQKIRDQHKGHKYAEDLLVERGAQRMLAGEDPKAWLRQARADAGIKPVRKAGKHRYLFSLGETRAQRAAVHMAMDALPYPKAPAVLFAADGALAA